MAHFSAKPTSLEKEYNAVRKYTYIWLFIGIISVLTLPVTSGLSFIPLAISSIGYSISNKKHQIVKSGVQGESSTLDLFANLSTEFTIHRDVRVIFDGKTSQLDHVIVGPQCVFIVETKNLKGDISGEETAKEWIQTKVGRKGTSYDSYFYNPIKQVNTHTYRLSSYLKAEGINIWVQPIVYFSNPDAIGTIYHNREDKKKEVPVYFARRNEQSSLIYYIEDFQPPKRRLPSTETLNKINELLR